MTNKKTLRRVVVLVLSLLLCSMSFLCVTLAKYQTTVTGTVSAPVAKWVFTAEGETSTFTIDDLGTKLAPGTDGSFTIDLANASDVMADYTVDALAKVAEGDTLPEGFNVTVENGTGSLDKTGDATVTINWAWAFDGVDTYFNTTDYSKTITIEVTVIGTQKAA